jgi:hypothetical protein
MLATPLSDSSLFTMDAVSMLEGTDIMRTDVASLTIPIVVHITNTEKRRVQMGSATLHSGLYQMSAAAIMTPML